MLEKQPDLVDEIAQARFAGDIPGLVDLDKTWDALQKMLGEELAEAVVATAGMTVGSTGFGPATIVGPERVAQLAAALEQLPSDFVEQRYAALHGRNVHGGYGQEVPHSGDGAWLREQVLANRASEIETLTGALNAVVELYRRAARDRHAMLSMVL
jgi:hypothetical protein